MPMQKKRILMCVVEVLCVVANSTIGCRNMSKFGGGGANQVVEPHLFAHGIFESQDSA